MGSNVPVAVRTMTFAGAGIVPVHNLPGWLQAFAKVQPVSLLAVFVPLAIAEYRKV